MAKKKSRLHQTQEKAEATIKKTNETIDELGKYTGELYSSLNDIQNLFDEIRGVPNEETIRYKEINSGKTGSESRLVERPVLAADYHEIPDDNTALAISLAEAGMVIRGSEFKGTATLTSAEAIAGTVAADTGSDLVKSWAELLGTLIRQSE